MDKFGGIKAFYFVGFLLMALPIGGNDAVFSRANTAIVFSRVFPINGSAGNPKDFIPLVSLLASKFTLVTTGVVDKNVHISSVLIPSAIAIFNKFHLKVGDHPLELSITFVITDVLNETTTVSPNGWDSLIKILDEANNIFPGTIKRIYVEHHGIISNAADIEAQPFERYFANANFRNSQNYEIGISLPIEYCKYSDLNLVLDHVQHLSIVVWPNRDTQELKVATHEALSEFMECKRLLHGYKKDITIRMETGWLYLNKTDEAEHTKKSLRYWTEVNDWAENTNKSVLLWEAFDIPNGGEETELDHTGLWKLVPNPHYKHIAEYKFEEKGIIATTSSFSWGLFFIVIILFIVGILSTLLLVRHFYPTVFYTKVAPYIPDFKRFW